jgi:hypothetical protein
MRLLTRDSGFDPGSGVCIAAAEDGCLISYSITRVGACEHGGRYVEAERLGGPGWTANCAMAIRFGFHFLNRGINCTALSCSIALKSRGVIPSFPNPPVVSAMGTNG